MDDMINILDPPSIPGLYFRYFRGESDYPKMASAISASADADKIERADTVEDITNSYAHLVNSNPYTDMIFAEVHGQVIGYSRGFWMDELNAGRVYAFIGFLVPAWRRKGIGRVMLAWMEHHLREIAESHPAELPKTYQAWVSQFQKSTIIMLELAGYQPIRYFHEMVRPTLEDIPDFPLPKGLEVRPVLPDQYHTIWEVVEETDRDHWGHIEFTEDDYQAWISNKQVFQPELWQVAWDASTNQIAGHVLTFINHNENEKYQRKRGYTEWIGVRSLWRKQGVARALIVRSLRAQKEQGMTESALSVDSENLSGATHLYEFCGFRVVKRNAIYRKPM